MVHELKFEGIDNWNRPIFKDIFNQRYGNTDKLFSWSATFEEIIEKVSEKDIQFFGKAFNCEPSGDNINTDKIKLVKSFSNKYLEQWKQSKG